MSRPDELPRRDNPFSTCRTRPGALPFQLPPGLSPEHLVERLRDNGWRGQIAGPHGSGKSALVASLIPAVERAGRQVLLIELHDAERRLPVDLRQVPALGPASLVIVDGCEQLARWNRFRLKRVCRRLGCGLLATCHRSLGLPELFRTSPSPEIACRIVERLLGDEQGLIAPEEVRQRFAVRQGDLRELLFDLYDVYEERRPRAR